MGFELPLSSPIQPGAAGRLPGAAAERLASAPNPERPFGETFARLLTELAHPVARETGLSAGVADPEQALAALGEGENQMSPVLAVLLQILERLQAEAEPAADELPAGLPVAGRISQGYHTGHRALDIAVPVGTPIRATMPGQVAYAGWNDQGYGNLVIVEQGQRRTYYAHLDRIPVRSGEQVAAGDVIGYSGNTGNSTGPHLHYEVRVNGTPVAPGEAGEHDE